MSLKQWVFGAEEGSSVSSSHLRFENAEEIASDFGVLVAELNDPIRWRAVHEANARGTKTKPLSFPLERLVHSKEQVQLALAVVIAEYALRNAMRPKRKTQKFINAAINASGDLVWLTKEPVFGNEGGPHMRLHGESAAVFQSWHAHCNGLVSEIRAQIRLGTKDPAFVLASAYWKFIDIELPGLLAEEPLAAIRKT